MSGYDLSGVTPDPADGGGGGGGGTSDASAANQVAGNTALGLIDGHVDGLETLVAATNAALATIDGRVDGLEALIGTTNTNLASLLAAAQLNQPTGTATVDEFTATKTVASVVRLLGITCQNTHATNPGRVEVSTPAGRVDIINLAANESVTHQFTPSLAVGGTLTITVSGTGTVSGAARYTL